MGSAGAGVVSRWAIRMGALARRAYGVTDPTSGLPELLRAVMAPGVT